jgi:hypothetical protein
MARGWCENAEHGGADHWIRPECVRPETEAEFEVRFSAECRRVDAEVRRHGGPVYADGSRSAEEAYVNEWRPR